MEAPAQTLHALWRCFEQGEGQRLAQLTFAMARRGIDKPLNSFNGHPLADEWHDFAHSAICEHLSSRRGLVYIAGNPAQWGLYKVGSTAASTSDARMHSLSAAGVVGSFQEVGSFACIDRFGAERFAHKTLEKIATRHKEFFAAEPRAIIETVRTCVSKDNALLKQAFPWVIGVVFQ